MKADEVKTEEIYGITGTELKLICAVRKRLYSEKHLNADDMRDLAHVLTCVVDAAWKED